MTREKNRPKRRLAGPVAGAAAAGVVLLAGCGVTPAAGGAAPHPAPRAKNDPAHPQRSPRAKAPVAAAPPAAALTLEQLTVTANALIITTTHGATPHTYWDPSVTPGSPPTFQATLIDTSAGRFPINQTRAVASNWATSEKLVPRGTNLVLVFALKPGYAPSQTSIGAGDMIQVLFGPS